MDLGLKNKTAVVTGGTSGIGLAVVKKLLAEGANVAFCARNEERLATVHQQLAEEFSSDQIFSQACSVLGPEALSEFATAVERRFGGCDILINNAGQGRVSTFADTSDQDWRDELELKFFSQIHVIRAFQSMLETSGTGSIVAVNSLLALQPEPHMVCTSAARAGVQNLLKSLSVELAPNIRVNSVLIGLVNSGQWQRRFAEREDQSQSAEQWYGELAAKKNIPLGRLGEAEEAANALVFLASNAASYITGAQLEVSGGISRFI